MYEKASFLAGLLKALFPLFCQAQAASQTSQNTDGSSAYRTSFVWQGAQLGQHWEPHNALLIPITVGQSSQVVYMQLDTGSPYTLVYGDKLRLVSKGAPQAELIGDTLLRSFPFKIGGRQILRQNVKVIQQGGPALPIKDEKIIIGTLGMDLLEPYVVTLDFPRQELMLTKSIPDLGQAGIALTDFYYTQHHILLPVILQAQRKMVYFDSGSSAFPLLIDQANWQKLASPDSVSKSYFVSSWSKPLKVTTNATSEQITIANQSLPINRVAYIDGASQNQISQMLAMGIGGMVGNQLFMGTVLVIDIPHKKFGVYKPK